MASKQGYGVGGLTGTGDNTRTRGPRSGGADGTATAMVTPAGNVNADVDDFVDRIMGREGAPGINENEGTRTIDERVTMSNSGNNRRRP